MPEFYMASYEIVSNDSDGYTEHWIPPFTAANDEEAKRIAYLLLNRRERQIQEGGGLVHTRSLKVFKATWNPIT